MRRPKWVTPVLFIALLGLLAYGAYWGYQIITTPIPPYVEKCVERELIKLTPHDVSVRVYNGGTISGLARGVSNDLDELGFHINDVDDSDESVENTVIIGTAANSPELLLVAGFFPGAEIRTHGRPDHYVDIILADSFAGLAPDAPLSVAVPGGIVCLPERPKGADPTPEPTPEDVEPTP